MAGSTGRGEANGPPCGKGVKGGKSGEPLPGKLSSDYCGTCALMVRSGSWDQLGGADKQIYPACYVDVDLCLGLWKLGALALCDPASSLQHHAQSSSSKPFRYFFCRRDQDYFMNKGAA